MRRETLRLETRDFVMKRDKGKCRYCGADANQIDHITPYSRGGDHDEDNLVACCKECNRAAGAKVFDTFLEKHIYILIVRCTKWGNFYTAESNKRQLKKLLKNPRVNGLSKTTCEFVCY